MTAGGIGKMPLKRWEVALVGTPAVRVYTEAGIRKILPQILTDVDFYVTGNEEQFARVLFESFPPDMQPISLTFYCWEESEEKDGDEGEGRIRLLRFYPEWILQDIGLNSQELAKLERDVKKVLLPYVSDWREVEGKVVREFGNIRVTYATDKAQPSRKDLHAVLEAFDDSGRPEATVVLDGTRSVRVEDEPDKVERDSMEFFVERVGTY